LVDSVIIIAVHAAHYASMMVLFGAFCFLVFIGRPAYRDAGAHGDASWRTLNRFCRAMAWCGLLGGLLSGMMWFALQAATMSGLPLGDALTGRVLATVVRATEFGQVWVLRLLLVVPLGALLLRTRHQPVPSAAFSWGGLVLAGIILMTLAFSGHANAEDGMEHNVHLVGDMVHLLASGAWLGALPPLARVLWAARRGVIKTATTGTAGGSVWLVVAQKATDRFSLVGMASVAALVITGLVNSWFLVGSIPALIGTAYGRLLLLKLAIFAQMLTLAAFNRLRHTPRLLTLSREALLRAEVPPLRWLQRNAILEALLGALLLVVVSAISISTPGAHTQPLWPLSFDFDWEAAQSERSARIAMAVLAAAAIIGTAMIAFGALRRRRWVTITGILVLPLTLGATADLLAVPAVPTSYYRSPIRYDVLSIAGGEPIYRESCVQCHGADGYGDGPAAASLAVKPANLTGEHLFHHGEGTLFWWVSNGIERSAMPAFRDILDEDQRWTVLQYLHAQADAEQGNVMNADIEPWHPIIAPDFAFQAQGRLEQETLKQQRDRAIVLLVLFSVPDSLARVEQLDAAKAALDRAGVRVIAVPLDDAVAPPSDSTALGSANIAETGPETAIAYSVFRRTVSVDGVPPMSRHMEFLIDRAGYLRFRWAPEYGAGWSDVGALLKQVDLLNKEPPRAPAPEGHVH
jgi:putative copper export protein/mono/diheme cytochrome c family protein